MTTTRKSKFNAALRTTILMATLGGLMVVRRAALNLDFRVVVIEELTPGCLPGSQNTGGPA